MRQAGEAPASHTSPEVDADAGLTAARTVGAPHFIAEVLCRASVRWYSADPPKFRADVLRARRGNPTPRIGRRVVNVGLARTHLGQNRCRRRAARDTLNEAILVMYDERNWAAVDGTLEVAPVLPAGDAPTVAATIYATSRAPHRHGVKAASASEPSPRKSSMPYPTPRSAALAAPQWTAIRSWPSRSQPSTTTDSASVPPSLGTSPKHTTHPEREPMDTRQHHRVRPRRITLSPAEPAPHHGPSHTPHNHTRSSQQDRHQRQARGAPDAPIGTRLGVGTDREYAPCVLCASL